MSTVDVMIGRTQSGTTERRGLPDPGESVPNLACQSRFTLIYSNRTTESTMLRTELDHWLTTSPTVAVDYDGKVSE